jgi:hypothetical protein
MAAPCSTGGLCDSCFPKTMRLIETKILHACTRNRARSWSALRIFTSNMFTALFGSEPLCNGLFGIKILKWKDVNEIKNPGASPQNHAV